MKALWCSLSVLALNPQTGAQRTVFTGEGAPMGGTVALQAGDRIYLGFFVGERVVARSLVPPAQ